MDTGIDLSGVRFSRHALDKLASRYCQLYGDENKMELERLIREMPLSRLMSAEELRNGREKIRIYPGTLYYRSDRFIFAVNARNQVVVTCMIFRGRRATRTKPKTRDQRAREKQDLHMLFHRQADVEQVEN